MDGLMPSEIARLVLGYLMETKCLKTTGMFLNESPHLSEYVDCLLKGKEYPATINGKTLLDILNEYATLKSKERRQERSECAPAPSTRSLLLSARNQHNFSTVSVGCGEAELNGVKQSECQTSPQQTSSVEVRTQIERLPTPAKCSSSSNNSLLPSAFTFSTPTSRPVDLYSSPSSLVKSVLFSLQDSTPSKCDEVDNSSADCRTNSPRRKGPLPRKRLYSPASANALTPSSAAKRRQIEDGDAASSASTPSSAAAAEDAVTTSGCVGDVNVTALIDGMLHNSVLHERIAANINHEKAHPTVSIAEIPDEMMPEMIIKNIVDRTESDPVFEAFLNVFLDKPDGSSRDSQSSQASMQEAKEACPAVPAAAAAETGQASAGGTHCASVSGAGDVAYLVPVETNNGSGSVFQLVLGASREVPHSGVQLFQRNDSQPKAISPPKLDRTTISPGQLLALRGAPAAAKKQLQPEKHDNQSLIRRGISKTDDKVKKCFVKPRRAVKSLDFDQVAAAAGGGSVRQPQLMSRTLKPAVPRADDGSTTTTTTVRPRLHSLLRSAESLEAAKTSDDVQAKKKPAESRSPKAKPKDGSKKTSRGKVKEQKTDGSQKKSEDKLVAVKVTNAKEGFPTSTQADLSNMNVNEFLSGMQYVD